MSTAADRRTQDASEPEPAEEIRSEDLKAWFGSNQALKGITLSIPRNQVTALIGPSGCGKSTYIRCLNRMHEVVPGARVEGKVIVRGRDIYDPRVNSVQVRRNVGMVFQRPNPFPTMSIRENVLAGLRLQNLPVRDAAERVERALTEAALWAEVKDGLDRSGASLSGGQQQRLCIARALALHPSVLLMDEPCSALDPIATAKVEELIQQLRASFTVVIVTHNMQQASRVSDYTAFLYLGELVEHARTEVLFTKPSKRQTEDYITGRFG
jgi:phosphate transport system ATP-binding protein